MTHKKKMKPAKGIGWTGDSPEHSLAARGVKTRGLAKDFKKESKSFGKKTGAGFRKETGSILGEFKEEASEFAKKTGFKSAKPKKKKKAMTKSGVMPLRKQKGSMLK